MRKNGATGGDETGGQEQRSNYFSCAHNHQIRNRQLISNLTSAI